MQRTNRQTLQIFSALTVLFALVPANVTALPIAGDEISLSGEILRTGQKLLTTSLRRLPGIGPGGLISVNVQIKSLIDFGSSENAAVTDLSKRVKAIEQRQKGETNAELLKILNVMKEQVDVAKKQAETQDAMLSLWREKFAFDTESVMRKPFYRFPDDKLVIVVSDFSSGSPEEGREIADEIAVHLADLVDRAGISCHILVGETKPGLMIRSDQMARDVGNSLPVNTEYVVIWGTMSPRTVGKYRPHITSCWKQGEKVGVGVGMDLTIEASTLPLSAEPQERGREAFRRLIGVTCAAIPSIYAAHEINRERTPDLRRYYDYLGEESEEARALMREVDPLTRWTRDRSDWSASHPSSGGKLKRVAPISVDQPRPRLIFDEKDGSVLSLITDRAGAPLVFNDEKLGNYVCYIDVLETSNDQFISFMNSPDGGNKENRVVGGAPWIDVSSQLADISKVNNFFAINPGLHNYGRNPVIEVSWFAARDYCNWAGKELPTRKEWIAAAERDSFLPFPWGDSKLNPYGPLQGWNYTMPCGLNEKDRSRNGCFDMRGNVREWCADLLSNNAEYAVAGGSYSDKDPQDFEMKRSRGMAQVSHDGDVGFRGVIRFPLAK